MMKELFTGHPPSNYIYPTYRGNLHRVIQNTCVNIGLPAVGLHDLRHICGTHWVINHGMAFASAALGHSSIMMTIDVYADLQAIVEARTRISPVRHPLVPRTITVAQDLVEHPDPSVRELALLALQVGS